MNINNIYTTISNGRTHIAADKNYIGSVNSYNNCFTKFFAWVFRCSMTVNFDGKMRSVNKQSYLKLISSLGSENVDVKIKNICEYNLFKKVVEKTNFTKQNKTMREAISDDCRRRLFHKLAQAISSGNTDKALKIIGKGAALDIEYYDRDKIGPSFDSDTYSLSSKKNYKFTVFKGTPILVAAKNSNTKVLERLKEYGASTDCTASQYTFKRRITGVSTSYESVPQASTRVGIHGQPYTAFNYTVQERTTIHFKDKRNNCVKYKLMNENLELI